MSRKRRLAEQARKLRNIVLRQDLKVGREPKLVRLAEVTTRLNPAAKPHTHSVLRSKGDLKSWADKTGWEIVQVRRLWRVSWDSSEDAYCSANPQWRDFDHLVLAQAQIDGLRFHLARYLMAKGTAAEKRL